MCDHITTKCVIAFLYFNTPETKDREYSCVAFDGQYFFQFNPDFVSRSLIFWQRLRNA